MFKRKSKSDSVTVYPKDTMVVLYGTPLKKIMRIFPTKGWKVKVTIDHPKTCKLVVTYELISKL